MASNKQHDNEGISPADQESLRRLGERPQKSTDATTRTQRVPETQLKPGRTHDRSNSRASVETDPHTRLGNTVESSRERPEETTHDNK